MPTPVLKIISEKLDLISDIPAIENGLRLVSVANYSSTEESMHNNQWRDFHPLAAECLCADIKFSGRALQSES